MTIDERLNAFEKLRNYLNAIDEGENEGLVDKVRNENPWFTPGSISLALEGVRGYLDPLKLRKWTAAYSLNPPAIRDVAVVMPGNIPLAGFHDFLSVLLSGHAIQVKLSSKDTVLLTFIADKLRSIEPRFDSRITIADRLKNFNAVIATGSDNSSRYFHYYFGKYPHIIRKNRTSCAILAGSESADELRLLGRDVFSYFGMGCRNVSKIFMPEDFDPVRLVNAWNIYVDILHHHKYHNNYDYQKSILLVNKMPFYDSGFVILQENEKMVSPISVVYFERYRDQKALAAKLDEESEKIQCIVGKAPIASVPFGCAQSPEVWDYADRVDTMKFLENLP